jgi:hypothetical protein
MDSQRAKYVAEIDRIKTAIRCTKSKYLKRDYQKALKRMHIELAKYDRYHNGSRTDFT